MTENSEQKKPRITLLAVGVTAGIFIALYFLVALFPEKEKELRQEFRNKVETTFPQESTKVAQSFGLTFSGRSSDGSRTIDPQLPTAVLIHGLDDPGKVWMNLLPALTQNNMNVFELRYPNDQPIAESARFFYNQLQQLTPLGITSIHIVGHSMGGLVSRDMLTNPQIAYSQNKSNGDVPTVSALIMVGTPNHGSGLARFRLFAEIRDQWQNMLKGQGHVLRSILDGAGEAKIDLLPNSQFLDALNARPHPEGVNMLVIAGIASPWNDEDIERFMGNARESSPKMRQNMLLKLEVFLKSMTDGLGDGLVTVESTRLDGINHTTVRGTHLSMIRNVSEKSNRTPPAIPLITAHLAQIHP